MGEIVVISRGQPVRLKTVDNGDGTESLSVSGGGGGGGGGDASAANQLTQIAAAGDPTDSEATGNGSQIAILKRLRTLMGTVATALSGNLSVVFPSAQAVTGPLTNTELRASAVPVSVSGVATASNQASMVTSLGATSDAEATGNGSIVALLKRLRTLLGGAGNLVVSSFNARVTATFNRPADTTAYAVGDLVANSTTAGSVTPMTLAVARANDGTGQIIRARVRKTGTSLTNASFRLHLFQTSPTVANGDNGAFLPNNAANYLGYLDVTMDMAFSDGASGSATPADGGPVQIFAPASGTVNIFGLLEARGAYTPTSGETFGATLEVVRD